MPTVKVHVISNAPNMPSEVSIDINPEATVKEIKGEFSTNSSDSQLHSFLLTRAARDHCLRTLF